MSEYLPSFIVEPVLRHARRFSERIGGEETLHSATTATTATNPAPLPESTGLDPASSRFSLPQLPNLPNLPSVHGVDFYRFNPTRFWNQSPPPSASDERGFGVRHIDSDAVINEDEDEDIEPQESTLQSLARNIQLWANQINNLDIIPSPPLDPVSVNTDDSVIPRGMDRSRAGGAEAATETIQFPPLEVEVPQAAPTAGEVSINGRETGRNDSDTSLNPANEISYRSLALENRDNGRSQSDPQVVHDESGQAGNSDSNAFSSDMYGRRRDGSETLPEDDGMGPLRKRINAVWAGSGTPQEKSRLVHTLMMEKYNQSHSNSSTRRRVGPPVRANSPSNISIISHDTTFNLSPADLERTYAPLEIETSNNDHNNHDHTSVKADLGCVHYKRNVKMQCATCERWYTCRLCHDEVEDHQLPRRETKHMLCMICSTPQRVGQDCTACGTQASCYYCSICKLWNNDAGKSIYHCDDCGICRLGEGLGKDLFHCKTCVACMSIQAASTHKCIERSTKCDCPICGEYMFTSNKPVTFMRCGHSIHESCFRQWRLTSYKCPICSKSIANMESQFRRLDRSIEEQPMPEEFQDSRAYVFCNDCNSRSVTKYHWLGLKCVVCDSYNTAQLEMLGPGSPQIQQQVDRAQELGVSEVGVTASQSHTPTEALTEPTGELLSGFITPSSTSRPTSSNSAAVDVPTANNVSLRSPPHRRDSPFHAAPHSPTGLVPRGASPLVGNYFNTGSNRVASENRRGSYFSVFSMGGVAPNEDATGSSSSMGYQHTRAPSSPLNQVSQHAGTNLAMPTNISPSVAAHTVPATAMPRGDTLPLDDDDDLSFWGGHSPRSYDAELVDVPGHDSNSDEDSDEDGDDDDDDDDDDDFDGLDEHDDDDDDDEDTDLMEIIGHR